MSTAQPFSDVNLVPPEVLAQRHEHVQKKRIRKIVFAFLGVAVVALFLSIGAFVYFSRIEQQKKVDLAQKEVLIAQKREFAKKAAQLMARVKLFSTLSATAPHYSKLLQEVTSRAPSAVSMTDLSQSNTSDFSFSGTATPNFPPVGEFQEALLRDKDIPEALFKDVSITSANFDPTRGTVQFSYRIKIEPKQLYESEQNGDTVAQPTEPAFEQ